MIHSHTTNVTNKGMNYFSIIIFSFYQIRGEGGYIPLDFYTYDMTELE